MIEILGSLWCRTFHREITRPVNGQYICLRCLRQFSAQWQPGSVRKHPEFRQEPRQGSILGQGGATTHAESPTRASTGFPSRF